MPAIFVSDSEFRRIQELGVPFIFLAKDIDTRIARQFGIEQKPKEEFSSREPRGVQERKRRPKTHYESLIGAGYLQNGEFLYLVDNDGKRVADERATFDGGKLRYDGRIEGLSPLADRLLRQHGKKASSNRSARGPAHWAKADGSTVRELWDQFLSEHPTFSYPD